VSIDQKIVAGHYLSKPQPERKKSAQKMQKQVQSSPPRVTPSNFHFTETTITHTLLILPFHISTNNLSHCNLQSTTNLTSIRF